MYRMTLYRVCLLKPENLRAWLVSGSGAPAPRWEKQPRGRGNFPCGRHHEPGAAARRAPCFPQRAPAARGGSAESPEQGRKEPKSSSAGCRSCEPAACFASLFSSHERCGEKLLQGIFAAPNRAKSKPCASKCLPPAPAPRSEPGAAHFSLPR